MRKVGLLVTGVAAVALGLPAILQTAKAQEAKPKAIVPIATPVTELEEAKRRLLIAQKSLDDEVKHAQAMIKARSDLKTSQRSDWVAALTKSQQQWTNFRETDCDLVYNSEKGLPLIPSAESLVCKASKATERAEELKRRYRR